MNAQAKRKQRQRRQWLIVAGYIVAVIIIAALTVILVAFGRGYSYNFQTHRVVRNGLLIMGSKPGGADVAVNGKARHKTPTRITLGTGSYQVTASKAGYVTWHKVVQIVASEVTFAQYILLIPTHLTTHKSVTVAGTMVPVQSPDQTQLAYVTDAAGDDLAVVGTGGGTQRKIWQSSPPTGNPSAPAGQITAASWSDDDSHLLVITVSNGQPTDWVVAADGSGATDVTDAYNLSGGQVVFAPGGWQKLYWNGPAGLRQINLANQTTTSVLASNVTQITPANGLLYYVQQTPLGRSLVSLDGNNHKQTVVPVVADSDSYSITAEDFDNHNYVAVVPDQTHTATVYIDPTADQPTTLVISRAADNVLFSPDGRYLLASGAAGGSMYDLDRTNVTGSTVLYGLGQLSPAPQDFVWLDNYHLLYRSGGRVYICEFDGGNNTVLGATLSPAYPLPGGASFDDLQTSGSQTKLVNTALR